MEDGLIRDENGKFVEGTAPGPGRPKGKTLKEYAREYYALKTDEEKKSYIEWLDEKKPGFAWTMGEGNPATATDITTKGEAITPLLVKFIENDKPSDGNTN